MIRLRIATTGRLASSTKLCPGLASLQQQQQQNCLYNPSWHLRKNVTVAASNRHRLKKEQTFDSHRFILAPPTSLGRPTTSNTYETFATNNYNQHRNDKKSEQVQEELLFEGSREKFALMRTGLGFSCFHTAYWLWYTTEFIPNVNASPMQNLHVEPAVGWAGFVFGLAIQAVFFVYPKRLVSRLTYRPAGFVSDGMAAPAQVSIYTHQLPLIQPATRPTAVVRMSSSEETTATLLDPLSKPASVLIDQLNGDIQAYEGVLAIRNPNKTRLPWRFPLLLDFQKDTRVPNSSRLLQALLYPQDLWRQQHHEYVDDYDRDHDNYYHRSRMSRQARKNESRLRKITRKRRKRR